MTRVCISPQHRVAVGSDQCQMLFGTSDVLVSAKSLINSTSVSQTSDTSHATYYHILLDQHELVRASGMWAETLFLGETTVEMLPRWTLAKLRDLSKSRTGVRFAEMKTFLPVLKTYEVSVVRDSLTPYEPPFVRDAQFADG